jgi:cytochrome oxidase Cu insertion factor (SCO1/SenC/PrrC family)
MKDTDHSEEPTPPSRSLFKGLLLGLAFVVLVAVGFLAARQYLGSDGRDASMASRDETASSDGGDVRPASGGDAWGTIGGPFTLVDEDGKTVTDQNFRGKWLLVYFGYTYCPDVCPTSLARNAEAVDLLGDKGKQVVPMLISVDPERDTPEKLKDYVHVFHPQMAGLTGTPDQIAKVARDYRVFYMKVEQAEAGAYLVDHSSITYLIGPDGRFVQVFSHQASPQALADSLKKLL